MELNSYNLLKGKPTIKTYDDSMKQLSQGYDKNNNIFKSNNTINTKIEDLSITPLSNQNYLSKKYPSSYNIKNPKLLTLKEKESITFVKCEFCNLDITKSIQKSHIEAHPTKILDWLYLGSYDNARNIEELKMINVKYILNCANECKNMFIDDFSYKKVTMTVI